MEIQPGDRVEILERGEWIGPFKVSNKAGRTPEHVVLEGPNGGFELYADAPFNIRIFDYSNYVKDTKTMDRIEALAKFLSIEVEEEMTIDDYISEDSYTENEFHAEGNSYLVLTDEEADTAAREYIQESLWAFNPSFLSSHTDLPEEVFSIIQNDRNEDANPVFYTLLTKCGDFNKFVEEAISSDGRGHFLAAYDFNENEEGEYFIYRTN